ncbi:MAG TPA: VCBS repeat-containing protein [Bacillales bacterium]
MDIYHLRNAIDFYRTKIWETNDPYYWNQLADAQAKFLAVSSNREMIENRPAMVAAKHGDINGDGIIDMVFLTADKTPDSPLYKNITLVVQDGRTHQYQQIPLKNNVGYNPTLFLGDFTGDKVEDISVVIDTGGSSGAIYSYVFTDRNGQITQIFNSESFNETYQYDVAYEDQYKATVISHHLNEKYILDLTYKGKDYLSEIYNANGRLKEPIQGWVNPLSGLYPIDFDRDGTYELEAYQRIAGRYNADSLGFVQTVLKWNGQRFVPERQTVAVFGGKI